ncbi:hypothetical protein BIFBIF_00192 [Bifidobacterium bifidum ATCC 29521 = JCM 1255 = DSM 20456]|nr:hypothetical protein BIFBIF_00192 [Bifidobacterium bifidum ATCC 29521 = JCM 1255 = DSM 20456]
MAARHRRNEFAAASPVVPPGWTRNNIARPFPPGSSDRLDACAVSYVDDDNMDRRCASESGVCGRRLGDCG